MLPLTDNISRIYIVYTDISKTIEKQEQLRRQYEEQLLQHYHKTGVNELILGHGNISVSYTHLDVYKRQLLCLLQ